MVCFQHFVGSAEREDTGYLFVCLPFDYGRNVFTSSVRESLSHNLYSQFSALSSQVLNFIDGLYNQEFAVSAERERGREGIINV